MWLYLIIFAIPVFAFVEGQAVNRSKLFLIIYLFALALFVGLADMFGGYDRYIYSSVFDAIANCITCGGCPEYLVSFSIFEPGFTALSYFIALITENRYIYIFIITMTMYFFFYKAFERFMTNYPLAMILFLGMVFFFSFTYLRQILACSVAWWGIKYLIDKKKWKFFAVMLVVALLHKSGIVFAALYFLPIKKWKPAEIIILLSICCIIGTTGITGSLYDAYSSASNLENPDAYSAEGGFRIEYLLEVLFFVVLILFNYQRIKPTRKNIVFLNMAWMFCAALLLFIRSSDGGRVAWYFSFGIIYTLTLICSGSDLRQMIKSKVSLVLVVIMLALYVRVYVSWQPYNNLYPYKTFLTNGHRYPDYSWARYEYDHNYDEDKFYRPAFRFLK